MVASKTKKRGGGEARRAGPFVLTGPLFLKALRYANACRLGRAEARERIAIEKGNVMAAIRSAITSVVCFWTDAQQESVLSAQPSTAAYVRWLADVVRADLPSEKRKALNREQSISRYAEAVLTEKNVKRWVKRTIDRYERRRTR